MIVAIDGPAGSGKSTVSQLVAEKSGFEYLNSGNFYRAVTYASLASGVDPEETRDIVHIAESLVIDIRNGLLCLNGNPVEHLLHTDEVDRWVAQHSAIPEVRHIVNRLLKRVAENRNMIIEGRDISTVVFPDAELKIFIDASVDERARRRFKQGVSALSEEQIRESLIKRDAIDRSKPFGNLKLAHGAVYLDTSLLTIDEVCDKVLDKIHEIEPCT